MELEQGKKYYLKYTNQFCHRAYIHKNQEDIDYSEPFIFVGKIKLCNGERNIFFKESGSKFHGGYLMYGTENINYVLSDEEVTLEKMKEMAKEVGMITIDAKKQNVKYDSMETKDRPLYVIDINYLISDYTKETIEETRQFLEKMLGGNVFLIDGSRQNIREKGGVVNTQPIQKL